MAEVALLGAPPLKRLAILLADYFYDLRRFASHSAFGKDPSANRDHLQAHLMIEAHGIEKGLSFTEFAPRRGLGRLRAAISHLARARRAGLGDDDTAVAMAHDAIANYCAANLAAGESLQEVVPDAPALAESAAAASVTEAAGPPLDKAECATVIKTMLTRASVREYADAPIAEAEIAEVVHAALRTPSVCNRQGFRVHYTLDSAVIATALAEQNGNRGFGHRVPGLFIVTSSLKIFADPSERNQAFVDGGLFAMSLMLSLHAHGFGNCPLNWSASYRQDLRLRGLVSLPDDEAVIMMIAFGKYPQTYRAAASRRYPLSHVMHKLTKR
jgi:nitroreductase